MVPHWGNITLVAKISIMSELIYAFKPMHKHLYERRIALYERRVASSAEIVYRVGTSQDI